MCTRYYLKPDIRETREINEQALRSPLTERFIRTGNPVLTSGEIRPANVVPVIAPDRNGKNAVFPMKWGFRLPKGTLIVNARTETAAVKQTFREAWGRRRCVIPASWYYEWNHPVNRAGQRVTGDKYRIRPRGSALTWLAGLYRIEGGLPCFTVLTREATEELRCIHDRMPLILSEHLIRDWISPDKNPEAILLCALTDLAAERVQKEQGPQTEN